MSFPCLIPPFLPRHQPTRLMILTHCSLSRTACMFIIDYSDAPVVKLDDFVPIRLILLISAKRSGSPKTNKFGLLWFTFGLYCISTHNRWGWLLPHGRLWHSLLQLAPVSSFSRHSFVRFAEDVTWHFRRFLPLLALSNIVPSILKSRSHSCLNMCPAYLRLHCWTVYL